VKAYERVGVQPVAARPVPPVDQNNLGIGVREQRVGESHSRRTRSDDEVVGLDFSHPCRLRFFGCSHGGREVRGVKQAGAGSRRHGSTTSSPACASVLSLERMYVSDLCQIRLTIVGA